MKCSDCKRWKTEDCNNNPDAKDLDYTETFACFELKDSALSTSIQSPRSAKKKAVIVGLICFPIGSVVLGLSLLSAAYSGTMENYTEAYISIGISFLGGLIALIGLSAFIAALIIKFGLRKATGWVIIAMGALLATGPVIFFFATQNYYWNENLGRNVVLILMFIFIVLSPFIGWRLLTPRRHPKHTKKSSNA